jgi:hypothetical protein
VLFFSFFRRYAPEDLKNRLYSPKIDIVPHKTPPRLRTDSLFGWVYDIYRLFSIKNVIYKFISNAKSFHYCRLLFCFVLVLTMKSSSRKEATMSCPL